MVGWEGEGERGSDDMQQLSHTTTACLGMHMHALALPICKPEKAQVPPLSSTPGSLTCL